MFLFHFFKLKWLDSDVLTYKVIQGASHIGILSKPELVDLMQDILFWS